MFADAEAQALFEVTCAPCGLWAPLHARGLSSRIFGEGNPDAAIILIGEGPARDESHQGRVFVGKAGQFLNRALTHAKLRRADVWITNVVGCWPQTETGATRKPRAAEIAYCEPYLARTIRECTRRRVIVTMGETATRAVLGPSGIEGGITENQGRVVWSEAHRAWVVITVHPAYAARRPQELFWIQTDLLRAQRIAERGKPEEPLQARYTVVRSLDQLHQARAQLLHSDYIVFDTETNGLHPTESRAFAYSFCGRERGQDLKDLHAWVIPRFGQGFSPCWSRAALKQVDDTLRAILFSAIPKGGTHLAFDIQMTLSTLGMWPHTIFHDVGIAHHLVNNHLPPRAHGLKVMSDLYTPFGRYDDPLDRWLIQNRHVKKARADRGAIWLAPDEVVHPYAATDVVVPHWLTPMLEDKIRRERLWNVYQQERLPLLQEYAAMDREGIRIDEKKLDALSADVGIILEQIEAEVVREVAHPLNINSQPQLVRYLYTDAMLPVLDRTPGGTPSTAEHVLKELAKLDAVPALVLHHRTFQKLKGTYIDGSESEVRGLKSAIDADGFARPSTRLTGVETHRLATGAPCAPHLIPQPFPVWHCETHGRYNLRECCTWGFRTVLSIRSLFVPEDPEHYQFLSADYRQQEFIIMCLAAKETAMEEALLDRGEDAHLFTMQKLFGRNKEEFFGPDDKPLSESLAAEFKNLRRLAKNANFASLFLVQAKKLSKMNGCTVEEAAKQLDTFYAALPHVKAWQAETIRELRATGRVVGLFRTYRYLPGIYSTDFFDQAEAERQGCNFKIQNAGAHVMFRGLIRLAAHWRGGRGPWTRADFPARVKWTVHDEVVALCRRDLVDEGMADMRRCLTQAHKELIGGCGIPRGLPVDVKALEAWE